jgi:glutamate synthase domain-containing protein 1
MLQRKLWPNDSNAYRGGVIGHAGDNFSDGTHAVAVQPRIGDSSRIVERHNQRS